MMASGSVARAAFGSGRAGPGLNLGGNQRVDARRRQRLVARPTRLEAEQRPAQRLQLDPAVALPVDADPEPRLQIDGLGGAQPDVEQPIERRRPPVDVDAETQAQRVRRVLALQSIDLLAPLHLGVGGTRLPADGAPGRRSPTAARGRTGCAASGAGKPARHAATTKARAVMLTRGMASRSKQGRAEQGKPRRTITSDHFAPSKMSSPTRPSR